MPPLSLSPLSLLSLLLLLPLSLSCRCSHARVRPSLVLKGVHVIAPLVRMCTSACARLGLHGSVQATGAG